MTTREKIERRLASNQRFYAHFVTEVAMKQIRKDTATDILKIFEKLIDEQIKDLDSIPLLVIRLDEELKK